MNELTPRQNQIVDAALFIISEMGFQNLTIKNLANRVKVTEGAIYRHFRSKEDILTCIAEYFKTSSTVVLQGILESSDSGTEQIKLFFKSRVNQFAQNPGLTMVMFSDYLFKNYADLQREVHATIHSHKLLIMQTLSEGQKMGEIRPDINAEHLFTMIMGSLRFLITRWRGGGFNFNIIDEGRDLWESIEKIIRI